MTTHRLLSPDAVDRHMKELVETTRYANPDTGERYAPPEPPEVDDPEGDEE